MARCSVCGGYYDDDNETEYWCHNCGDRPNMNMVHDFDEPFYWDYQPRRRTSWVDYDRDDWGMDGW